MAKLKNPKKQSSQVCRVAQFVIPGKLYAALLTLGGVLVTRTL